MAQVVIDRDFALPAGRIFAHLSEHENLGPLFGARVTRVRDGDTDRNGVGSVRRLRIAVLPAFEETVTRVLPDELIEYRITRGSPLRGHRGIMVFTATGTGCHLRYTITFSSVVPGLAALVSIALRRNVSRGLQRVDGIA
jgi:hypothetical protein